MNRLILKSFLFSSIFILIFGSVFYLDPFHKFHQDTTPDSKSLDAISLSVNAPLFKLVQYSKNPISRIILGDSRMNSIDTEYILKLTGQTFYNFSYDGATFEEMCSSFWIATKLTKIESVCFGFDLNHFNISNSRNRIPGAYRTANNFFLYISNRDVLKVCYYKLFHDKQTNQNVANHQSLDQDQFWDYSLDVITRRYFLNYKFGDKKIVELKRISDYCQANDIDLFFIIPFSHEDLQEEIKKYVNTKLINSFPTILSKYGRVYNFNFPNSICRNKSNFRDPYHVNKEVTTLMCDEVWGKQKKFVTIFRHQK